MKAKDFLLQVSEAERKLVALSAQKRHLLELATAIGVNLTGMPGKKEPSSRVENVATVIDLTNELVDEERRYVALVQKARDLIGQLKQEKFQKVLTLRYLCHWSWRSIRDELDYKDEKSVFACHRYALRELQKLM
jgi:hypothetical protein